MKKNIVKNTLLSFVLSFLVSLLLFVIIVFTVLKLTSNSFNSKPSNNITGDDGQKGFIDEKLSAPRKTNFLLTGVDQSETLTDVIIVGTFDSKTEEFTMISIPRDTYVKMPENLKTELKADNIYVPTELKLNELHSYVGKAKGMYYLERYLECTMGIEIDYYALVNTRAFRDIVDAVGGIEMEIRAKGYYYNDPEQNLVISVPGGKQLLNGTMAEGVVRYRNDYVQGDIDRINVQQDFMKAFFEQVLTKEALTENGFSILKTCISYTKTNFNIAEAPKYVQYIPNLSGDSITLVTAPGEGKTIGGRSYFMIDTQELSKMVNLVFYGDGIPKIDHNLEGLSIEILNGSDETMLATKKKSEFELVGYSVDSVGNSKGEKIPETIIYTKEGVDATALEVFFDTVIYKVDEEITNNYDIVIVLGTLEH